MAGLVFFTDDALFKMPYLAMKDITKKWTGRRQDLRSAERCLHL
jgi:transposase-like protein